MNRAIVLGLCSVAQLARQNHRLQSVRMPAVGKEGCSGLMASAIGQDREGFPAGPANSAPYPDEFVLFIVGRTQSPSVADDRVITANGTLPRQQV